MSDVYRVAVALQMSSNHSAILGALASGLIGAQHQVSKLNKGLAETTGAMTRMKLALGGGLALAGGTAILATLKKITDHTRDLSKELATLKTQGLTPLQIRGADTVARATTTMVPGSTESGNLKLLSEAYSLMGLENAKKALPDLSRAVQVFGAIDGNYKRASESLYSLLRSGEMLGKLQDEHTGLVDPAKLKGFLDVMSKVSAATGNKVNAQTLFGMVQQGAPALANMNDDGLMAMLMAAQQMGGPRAGTALTSMYQQFQGGTMTEARAKELRRLGLIGDYDVGRGGHLTFKPGALDTDFARSLEKNPLDAMKLLQGAMRSHGFESIEAQTKELFMILGRQTTQRLVSDFIRNLPNMASEQGRLKGGQGLDAQAQTRNTEDYSVVEHNMHQAWQNLMEALGGPQSKAAISVMGQITGALNGMTAAVRATNPETLAAIGKGLLVLGGALTAGGAVALVAALGPAGWIAGGLVAAGAAVIAFKPQLEGLVASVAPLAAKLEEFKTKTYTAIADFAPKLVAEVASWPTRLASSITALGESLVTMLSDMLRNLISKLNPFSRTSFEGGTGLGGLVQKASFSTGGANDNGAIGGASGVARTLGREGLGGSGGGAGLAHARGVLSRANPEMVAYIRQSAIANGINPDVALRIAASEGLGGSIPGVRMTPGDKGTSFGPYQLHYGGRGSLGTEYTRATGHHAGDPKHWQEQIDFALRYAGKNKTWAPWFGRGPAGVGTHEGFGYKGQAAPTAGPPPKQQQMVQVHTDVHLEGKKVGRIVAQHIADDHRFPLKAGGMDTHGSFRSPGTPVTDAA